MFRRVDQRPVFGNNPGVLEVHVDELFSFLDSLPTGMKQAFVAGMAGTMIPLLFGTKPVLKWLGGLVLFGEWRPFSPNNMTIIGLVLSLIGIAIFFAWDPAIGIGVGGFGAMIDRLDGRMAHVQDASIPAPSQWETRKRVLIAIGTRQRALHHFVVRDDTGFGRWWFEMNFPGGTDLGKVLDPAADKVKTFVLFVLFAWNGLLAPWLVVIHTVPELLGTLVRRPFYLFARFQKEPKATAIGKWKAVIQWIVVITCILFYQSWFTDGISEDRRWWIDNGVLILSTLLALMSVASRLKFVRDSDALKDTLKSLDSGLSHD